MSTRRDALNGNRAAQKLTGFTMVELMLVLAIIGILLLTVVPSYSESVRKSRRADAMKELMELAGAQERFYAQRSSYTTDIDSSSGLNRNSGGTSSQGHYAMSAEACSDAPITRCYLLKAAPVGSQQKDTACGTLSLDQRGQRAASGPLGDKCW